IAGRGTIFEAVPADEGAGVAATRAPDAETVGGSVVAQHASERRFDFLFRHRLAAVDVFQYPRVAVEPHEVAKVVARELAQVEAQCLHPGFHNSRSLAPLGVTGITTVAPPPAPRAARPGIPAQ